jgi:hypothetical protein
VEINVILEVFVCVCVEDDVLAHFAWEGEGSRSARQLLSPFHFIDLIDHSHLDHNTVRAFHFVLIDPKVK